MSRHARLGRLPRKALLGAAGAALSVLGASLEGGLTGAEMLGAAIAAATAGVAVYSVPFEGTGSAGTGEP